jgi:hypothetical protein
MESRGLQFERRLRRHYESVFAQTYGEGPYVCYFCTEVIDRDLTRSTRDLDIHHLDHDETNNDPLNLVPSHHGCHLSYHMKCQYVLRGRPIPENFKHDMPHTEEAKRKVSDAHKASGHAPTMEARSAGGKVPWTDQRRANQSKAQSNRSPEWREKNAAANRGKKRTPESREKMRQAALARHARERALIGGGDANDI